MQKPQTQNICARSRLRIDNPKKGGVAGFNRVISLLYYELMNPEY